MTETRALVVLQIEQQANLRRTASGLFYPPFTAGVVVKDGVIVQTAPILKWAKGWAIPRFIERCVKNRWLVTVVASNHPDDRAADPMLPSVEEDPSDSAPETDPAPQVH